MMPLRNYIFRPLARSSDKPYFILKTWDLNRRDHLGKELIAYSLVMHAQGEKKTLFYGEDFACSPLHPMDSVATAHALMSFLTLKPGDTDADYFADYTNAQKDFCVFYAEALRLEVSSRWERE